MSFQTTKLATSVLFLFLLLLLFNIPNAGKKKSSRQKMACRVEECKSKQYDVFRTQNVPESVEVFNWSL